MNDPNKRHPGERGRERESYPRNAPNRHSLVRRLQTGRPLPAAMRRAPRARTRRAPRRAPPATRPTAAMSAAMCARRVLAWCRPGRWRELRIIRRSNGARRSPAISNEPPLFTIRARRRPARGPRSAGGGPFSGGADARLAPESFARAAWRKAVGRGAAPQRGAASPTNSPWTEGGTGS